MRKDLDGKVALITGAGSGIGAATASLLAGHGAFVIAADCNMDGADRTVTNICKSGLDASSAYVDLEDPSSIEKFANQIITGNEHIDIIVNSGGIISRYSCEELPLEQWDKVVNINLRGMHLIIQSFIKKMREQGGGKIVNISSLAGRIAGHRTSPDYASSKGGVMALTRSYAAHYAKYNINVNAVAPGLIITPMTEGRNKPEDVPIGRLGTAEDIANAVYFLSSKLSDYITGITLDVNGGMFTI